jgi:hypothetical protein
MLMPTVYAVEVANGNHSTGGQLPQTGQSFENSHEITPIGSMAGNCSGIANRAKLRLTNSSGGRYIGRS